MFLIKLRISSIKLSFYRIKQECMTTFKIVNWFFELKFRLQIKLSKPNSINKTPLTI